MSILFYQEEVELPLLNYDLISKWLKGILRSNKKQLGSIVYIFCNDDYLLDINVKFLDHNYLTDIITFDYVDDRIISGDLFISIERIQENSVLFSSKLEDEYLRVIVHGLLHLLGYSDHTPEEKSEMKFQEDAMISKFYKYK